MSIAVSESMIGLKITTIQGNKEKVIDVTSSGYKLDTRRSQVKARQIVKKGKAYIEIEKPGAKQIRDTGMGYVEIIDPELYLEVMGKKMPKALLKEIQGDEAPAKKPKGKKSKAKAEKPAKKSKGKKSKAKAEKPAKEKKAKREDLELLSDYELRVPEGLRTVVANAIKRHLADNFNTPGPVRVITEMDVFDFIGDDGAVGAMNIGIHWDLPEVETPVITEKTMQKVKAGLWEKNEKLRALCFKKFGADFQIHDIFVDEDGEEYIFAGANVAKKKPILVFHRPEDEKCISAPVAAAAARLELATSDDQSEEEEFDEFDDLDLVDGDELEETVTKDRASLIDEDAIEDMDAEEVSDYLEDFDTAILVDYFNTEFEGPTRREKRVIASGDKTAIIELLVKLLVEDAEEEDGSDTSGEEFSEDDFDADFASDMDETDSEEVDETEEDDGEFEDDLSDEADGDDEDGEEVDADSDADDFEEIEDDLSDLNDSDEDDSDELEDGEEVDLSDETEEGDSEEGLTDADLDEMLDALVEAEHVTQREARRLTDEQVVDLYNEHFADEDEGEVELEIDVDDALDAMDEDEGEVELEIDVDDALDAMLDADIISAKAARRMDDEAILEAYSEWQSTLADEGEELESDESGEEGDDDEIDLSDFDEDEDGSEEGDDDLDDLSDFDED